VIMSNSGYRWWRSVIRIIRSGDKLRR